MAHARSSQLLAWHWLGRAGLSLIVLGALLGVVFALSAKWWVGYCSATWLIDLGDGTIYIDSGFEIRTYLTPLEGWCAGVNRQYLPHGGEKSWTWTWWTWGERAQLGLLGSAYTVWPLSPLLMMIGLAVSWPARRAVRRRKHGQCASCGYSRAGLHEASACPECGMAAVAGVGAVGR